MRSLTVHRSGWDIALLILIGLSVLLMLYAARGDIGTSIHQ